MMIWVVEMRDEDGTWRPTVGVRLSRDQGRDTLADWRKRNPDDAFRLVKYVKP